VVREKVDIIDRDTRLSEGQTEEKEEKRGREKG
jgi:hypothetical protein